MANEVELASDSLGIYIRIGSQTEGWRGGEWFGPYESRREALEDHGLDATQEPPRTPWTISDVAMQIFGV